MFKIKFLPARFGDSIWIEYGKKGDLHRVLIDGGTAGAQVDISNELLKLPVDQRRFDLVVISHIDRDHIEGLLGLLSQDDPGFKVDDFWFNGWGHLPASPEDESFGSLQGERLTSRIRKLHLPWNQAFDEKAVFVPDTGDLPQKTLTGGMKITLLSPTLKALAELKPVWAKEVREANLEPGFGLASNDALGPEEAEFAEIGLPNVEALAGIKFDQDQSEANASSIAFLAEYEGKRVLCGADAHAGVLIEALNRLSPGKRVSVNLFKVSHHGSKRTTNRELIEKVDCSNYIFSTNGSIFKHPDRETISRVLITSESKTNLFFNYRSKQNEIWDQAKLKERYGYTARYPAKNKQGITVVV